MTILGRNICHIRIIISIFYTKLFYLSYFGCFGTFFKVVDIVSALKYKSFLNCVEYLVSIYAKCLCRVMMIYMKAGSANNINLDFFNLSTTSSAFD